MSYCRFGEADVYIISSGADLNCILCSLCDGELFCTASRSEMLAHVGQHRVIGNHVPDSVDERLRREIVEKGDEVS